MTADRIRAAERDGSFQLKDELEVVEEIEDGQQVMHLCQET